MAAPTAAVHSQQHAASPTQTELPTPQTRHTYRTRRNTPVPYGKRNLFTKALRGLGSIGTLGADPTAAPTAGAAAVTGTVGMTTAGIHGAIIGGLSAASWKGAGTGALFGAGLTGIGMGAAITVAGLTSGDGLMTIPGLLFLGVGVGATAWGSVRFSKARRRR